MHRATRQFYCVRAEAGAPTRLERQPLADRSKPHSGRGERAMSIPFTLLLKSLAGGASAFLVLLMVAGPHLLGHAPSGTEQITAALAGAVLGAGLALKA